MKSFCLHLVDIVGRDSNSCFDGALVACWFRTVLLQLIQVLGRISTSQVSLRAASFSFSCAISRPISSVLCLISLDFESKSSQFVCYFSKPLYLEISSSTDHRCYCLWYSFEFAA